MSLIRAADLGDDLEDKIADTGNYDLRCTSAKVKTNEKNDRKYITLSFNIEDGDGSYAPIYLSLFTAIDSDEPSTVRRFNRDTKRALTMLGIPLDTDIDEDNVAEVFVGTTCNCRVVKVEAKDSDNNKTGDWKNEIQLPKVA